MDIRPEIEKSYEALVRYGCKLTGSTDGGYDLAHETILRALENADSYTPREGSTFTSWILRVEFNCFVSGWRRRKKFDSQYDPEFYISKLSVPPTQENRLYLKQVLEYMDRLSADQLSALVSASIGNTYEESAERAGVPVGTVRSRLSRARNALRLALDE